MQHGARALVLLPVLFAGTFAFLISSTPVPRALRALESRSAPNKHRGTMTTTLEDFETYEGGDYKVFVGR